MAVIKNYFKNVPFVIKNKMILGKIFKELLKEEQGTLLDEINGKAKKRISVLIPDTYADEPRFKNITYKKRFC